MIIYLIFSQQGFAEAKPAILAEQAILWVNLDFLSEQQAADLRQAKIMVNTFANGVNGSDEKSILQALKPIEQESPQAKILIEYI